MTRSLPQLLAEAAAARPRDVAAQVGDGPQLTYGAWQERSDAQACALLDAGIGAGHRLALLFDTERWTEYAVAYVAALKSGAVPLPLSAELSALEIARALRAAGAAAMVAHRGTGPSDLPVRRIDAESLGGHASNQQGWSLDAPHTLEVAVRSRPLAAPVVRLRTAEAVLAGATTTLDAAGNGGALLHWWPVGAVPGQDALCAALLPGGPRSVVLPTFDQDAFWSALDRFGVTACSLHPAVAEALLDTTRRRSVTGLRGLILASGRVSPALRERIAELLPGVRVFVAESIDIAPMALSPRGVSRHGPAAIDVTAAVTAAWRRILRNAAVAEGESLFDAGGDGVRAARLLRLVEDALGVRVRIGDFLQHPTVAGLTRLVTQALATPAMPTPPDSGVSSSADVAPAAFSQEGMLWHECFAPGCQNLPGLARRFRGPLDLGALDRALDEIVRRHQPLRSTFIAADGRLLQVIHPAKELGVTYSDISSLPPEAREAQVERRVAEAGAVPFDLVDGPLFEVSLLRLAADDHALVIRTHHSVFDDWSVGVFRRQLSALYDAYASGRSLDSPAPPMTFAMFAREQRRVLAGQAGADELGFWEGELRDAPLATQLAVQDPGTPQGGAQAAGGPISITLPADVTVALRSLARDEHATVFMVLLAAFGVLVSCRTGQQDLLLSTVVANRNRTELEPLIGCFTKKVPLRLDLRRDPDFTQMVALTRRSLLGVLQHQDLPFEAVLQEVLGPRAQVHGLVPTNVVMVQGVTPRQPLVMPDLETAGLETSSRATRDHFMSAPATRRASPPWGSGIYLGTFVIISLSDTEDELSCTARGAFDSAAVRVLLDEYADVVAGAVATPQHRLSELTRRAAMQTQPDDSVDLDGFRVDVGRMAGALSKCPGVRRAGVRLDHDGDGAPRLIAEILPDGVRPSADTLRTSLWTTLPGYAWPAVVATASDESLARGGESAESPPHAGDAGGPLASTADATLLGALWAEVLGIDRCGPDDNYWQDFSFLEVLAVARDAGVRIPTALVTRNRTLRTLATALAAARAAANSAAPASGRTGHDRHVTLPM